jgi:hypothetical protein
MGSLRFITAFNTAHHLSLSWARSIQSPPSEISKIHFIEFYVFHTLYQGKFFLFIEKPTDAFMIIYVVVANKQSKVHLLAFLYKKYILLLSSHLRLGLLSCQDHTQLDTISGRFPLYEWSACRRGQHLYNKHNRKISTPSARFETISQQSSGCRSMFCTSRLQEFCRREIHRHYNMNGNIIFLIHYHDTGCVCHTFHLPPTLPTNTCTEWFAFLPSRELPQKCTDVLGRQK